jgi:hypothetical protein
VMAYHRRGGVRRTALASVLLAALGVLTSCAESSGGRQPGTAADQSPRPDAPGCRQVTEALAPVRSALGTTALPATFAATADAAVTKLTTITSVNSRLRSALGFVAIDLSQVSAQLKAKKKPAVPVAALRKDLAQVDAACA